MARGDLFQDDFSKLEGFLLVGGIFSLFVAAMLYGIGVSGYVLITDEEKLPLGFIQFCIWSNETRKKDDCRDYGNSPWPELEEYSRLARPYLYACIALSWLTFVPFFGTWFKADRPTASWKARYFIVHSLFCALTGGLITRGLTVFVPKVTELVQGTLSYGVYLCAIAAGIFFIHGLFLIVEIKSWVSYIYYKITVRRNLETPAIGSHAIASYSPPTPFIITASIRRYQSRHQPQFMLSPQPQFLPLQESFQRSKMSKYPKDHRVRK